MEDERPEDDTGDQPRVPLLLPRRRSSISSLDESSQKFVYQRIQDVSINTLISRNSSLSDATTDEESNKLNYTNEAHAINSFNSLCNMRMDGYLCDIILVAAEIEIPAHKNVLASTSPYFYAMFTGFDERTRNRVEIKGVDPQALKLLIDYVYTSKIVISEINVQSLLPAANLLQLIDVKEACCGYLQQQLHASNCLGIRTFAELHDCTQLKTFTDAFIDNNFDEVLKSEEFISLDSADVSSLISRDTLCVSCEERIYESILAWIRHDETARIADLFCLMSHVRIPLMAKEYLLQIVDSSEDYLVRSDPLCKDLLIEALKFHLLSPDLSSQMSLSNVRARTRMPIESTKVMVAIGGQAPKAISSIECYSFSEDIWSDLTDLKHRRCRCGVAYIKGYIYVIGGFNGSLRVKSVNIYDPIKDSWSFGPNMEIRRSTLGVAVLNDRFIYAVGGFDGTSGLSSAEVLDLSDRIWRPISSMATRRSSVGVGVLGGLIYAVGGYDGHSRQCLSCVESYNSSEDVWKPVQPMRQPRSGAGVGVIDGLLYVVGGHDGPLVRNSVECYNPSTNRWTNVAEMNFCRRNSGVVVHKGLLYVIGGDDGNVNLQSMEVYSPRNNFWSLLSGKLNTGRSYTGVCIIDGDFISS